MTSVGVSADTKKPPAKKEEKKPDKKDHKQVVKKDEKKGEKKDDKKHAAKEEAVTEVSVRRGFGRINFKVVDHEKLEKFAFALKEWKRHFSKQNATVGAARILAGQSEKALGDIAVDELARALFVLDMEDKGAAEKFRAKLKNVVAEHGDLKVKIGDDVTLQGKFYHELYHLPCRGNLKRTDSNWPPAYE